jgi:type IV pilus assembly protein PilB
LVQANAITPEQLADILREPRDPRKKIGQLLIERGWLTEVRLTQTLSLQLSVPWVSLSHIDFSSQLLDRVARSLAERHCIIPIFVRHVKGQGDTLYVAMDDPTNEGVLAEVSMQAGLPTRPMIASASDIRRAIRVYYGEAETEHNADAIPITIPGALTRDVAAVVEPESARSPSRPPPVPRAKAPSEPNEGPETARSRLPSAPSLPSSSGKPTSSPPSRPAPPPPSKPPSSPPRAAPAVSAVADAPSVASHRRGGAKMLALTLLDGTTINMPPRSKSAGSMASNEALTAHEFLSALRAAAHGADAAEILGDKPQWEPVVAALLSLLLRKGFILDSEFIEELRKI